MMDDGTNNAPVRMRPEPTTEITMTDRELLEYCARMLERLEPLLAILENPPPMMAAMIPGLIDTSED